MITCEKQMTMSTMAQSAPPLRAPQPPPPSTLATSKMVAATKQRKRENTGTLQTRSRHVFPGSRECLLDLQFMSVEAGYIMYMLFDHDRKNPLFRSPISDTVQNILDVGTGTGICAKEVADRYPSAVVKVESISHLHRKNGYHPTATSM